MKRNRSNFLFILGNVQSVIRNLIVPKWIQSTQMLRVNSDVRVKNEMFVARFVSRVCILTICVS